MDSALATIPTENAGELRWIKAPDMLIEDLIPCGSITVLAGPSYSGKTFLAMEIAQVIGYGGTALGRWPGKRIGNVWFIEQDSPKYDTGRAFYAMMRHKIKALAPDTDNGAEPLDAFRFSWHPGIDLKNPLWVGRIKRTAREFHTPLGISQKLGGEMDYRVGCDLIVFDTMRACHTAQENDSTEMELIMQSLKDIRAAGLADYGREPAIILIHHAPKGPPGDEYGMGIRGSTAIEAAADNIYRITPRANDIKSVTTKKSRAIQAPDFQYTIETSKDEQGIVTKVVKSLDPNAESVVRSSTKRVAILNYILDANTTGRPRQDIVDRMALEGISSKTVERTLKALLEAGAVRKHTDKKDKRKTRYLPPEEKT